MMTRLFALRAALALCAFTAAALLCAVPARADMSSPLAAKDGTQYKLEDLSVYLLRNAGKDGLLAFLQEMVIYQEGVKQGLQPTDAEIQEFIDKVMTPEVYNQFKQLFNEGAVRQLIEYTLVNDKYDQWLRNKIQKDKNITVTEKEAKDYFLKNIDQFHLPEGVALSIISVDNQTQATKVLDRLKKGENFGDIAAEVNMDEEMRAARGELGVYRLGDGLPKPLEDAAFKLQEGGHSDVIKGTNFHILYCSKRYPSVEPGFDEIKERLMSDMLEAKIDPHYFQAMDDLMGRELPRFSIQAELFRPDEADLTAPRSKPASDSKSGGSKPAGGSKPKSGEKSGDKAGDKPKPKPGGNG